MPTTTAQDAPHLGRPRLIGYMEVELADRAVRRTIEPCFDIAENFFALEPVHHVARAPVRSKLRDESRGIVFAERKRSIIRRA